MFEIAGKANPRCYVAKPKLKDKFGMERMRNAMKVHPYPHAILPTPLHSPSSKENTYGNKSAKLFNSSFSRM